MHGPLCHKVAVRDFTFVKLIRAGRDIFQNIHHVDVVVQHLARVPVQLSNAQSLILTPAVAIGYWAACELGRLCRIPYVRGLGTYWN